MGFAGAETALAELTWGAAGFRCGSRMLPKLLWHFTLAAEMPSPISQRKTIDNNNLMI
jgi:hypothetical protein